MNPITFCILLSAVVTTPYLHAYSFNGSKVIPKSTVRKIQKLEDKIAVCSYQVFSKKLGTQNMAQAYYGQLLENWSIPYTEGFESGYINQLENKLENTLQLCHELADSDTHYADNIVLQESENWVMTYFNNVISTFEDPEMMQQRKEKIKQYSNNYEDGTRCVGRIAGANLYLGIGGGVAIGYRGCSRGVLGLIGPTLQLRVGWGAGVSIDAGAEIAGYAADQNVLRVGVGYQDTVSDTKMRNSIFVGTERRGHNKSGMNGTYSERDTGDANNNGVVTTDVGLIYAEHASMTLWLPLPIIHFDAIVETPTEVAKDIWPSHVWQHNIRDSATWGTPKNKRDYGLNVSWINHH